MEIKTVKKLIVLIKKEKPSMPMADCMDSALAEIVSPEPPVYKA